MEAAEADAELLLSVDRKPSGLTMSAHDVVRFCWTGAGGDADADALPPCMVLAFVFGRKAVEHENGTHNNKERMEANEGGRGDHTALEQLAAA